MLIYTSYFAQVKNLPSDIVPISIAAKQVPGWRYPVYKALAPTYNILYDYKRDGDKDHYVADLETLSGTKVGSFVVRMEERHIAICHCRYTTPILVYSNSMH